MLWIPYIQKGVTGFYVNGSTAEVFLLTEEERKYLYKFVKDIVGDRCTLIAHIGSVGTLQTIEYGKCAENLEIILEGFCRMTDF